MTDMPREFAHRASASRLDRPRMSALMPRRCRGCKKKNQQAGGERAVINRRGRVSTPARGRGGVALGGPDIGTEQRVAGGSFSG
eukprot:COSAG01_NODE_2894_length_6905_cov_2.168822_4_plen_84_part_00